MFALRAAAAGCIVSGRALLPRAGHVSAALRNSRGCASAPGRLADASPSTELPRWGFVPLERGRQLTSMVRRDGEKFVEYYKLQCVAACVSSSALRHRVLICGRLMRRSSRWSYLRNPWRAATDPSFRYTASLYAYGLCQRADAPERDRAESTEGAERMRRRSSGGTGLWA